MLFYVASHVLPFQTCFDCSFRLIRSTVAESTTVLQSAGTFPHLDVRSRQSESRSNVPRFEFDGLPNDAHRISWCLAFIPTVGSGNGLGLNDSRRPDSIEIRNPKSEFSAAYP
jgi:hypothetical protein